MEVGFFAGLLLAFAYGTFWFWLASVAAFLGILIFEEREENFGAFIVLGIFILLMENSGAFNIFADPLTLIKWTGLYFVVGAVWSFVKWFSFLNKRADQYKEHKETYIANYSEPNSVPDCGTATNPSKEFKKYLDDASFISAYYPSRVTIIPTAKDNLDKLATWILWWPMSFVWTMLNDPLVRLARYMVRQLNIVYDGIANKVFAKFE